MRFIHVLFVIATLLPCLLADLVCIGAYMGPAIIRGPSGTIITKVFCSAWAGTAAVDAGSIIVGPSGEILAKPRASGFLPVPVMLFLE